MAIKKNSKLTLEEKVVNSIYEGINQNNISAVISFFDPQIQRVEPEGFPSSGTYRGIAEVEAHFTKARDTWAEGSCDVEQLTIKNSKVVAFVHVKVKLKHNHEWVEGHIADGFNFRKGKVFEFKTFINREEALAWARE